MYEDAAAVPDGAHSLVVITINSHEQHLDTITVKCDRILLYSMQIGYHLQTTSLLELKTTFSSSPMVAWP